MERTKNCNIHLENAENSQATYYIMACHGYL